MTSYLTLRHLWKPKVLACLVVLPALACTDTLLNVTDPDIILGANSASSAIGLSNGAVLRLAQAVSGTQGPDALFVFGGLLTDEWRSGDTFIQRNTMDQRIWDPTNTFNAGPFRNLNRVRTQALLAIDGLRAYQPDSVAALARMFDFLAYTQVLLGEHYCNGVPLSGISGTEVIFGEPISNDSLFRLAIANADSALAIAGSDTASSRVKAARFAMVIKGRALVDRTDFAAAAAVVAAVPDTFRYDVTHSLNDHDTLSADPVGVHTGSRADGTHRPGRHAGYRCTHECHVLRTRVLAVQHRTPPGRHAEAAPPVSTPGQHCVPDRRLVQGRKLRRRDSDGAAGGGAEQLEFPRMRRPRSVTLVGKGCDGGGGLNGAPAPLQGRPVFVL